jgi:hypothetical protein
MNTVVDFGPVLSSKVLADAKKDFLFPLISSGSTQLNQNWRPKELLNRIDYAFE